MEEDREPTPISGDEDSANRRRSGRAKRKPELYSTQDYNPNRAPTKRKRALPQGESDDDASELDEDEGEGEIDAELEEEEDEEESSEGEADEEELKERRRAARKAAGRKPKEQKNSKAKHTAKKAKISNGVPTELALRPAVNGERPKSKSKKPRPRPSGFTDEEGLYAEVFARGHTTEAAAAEWLTKYEHHNINAMADLVNFVLRCSGTDLKVEASDIEDVDNVANRLNDLQEEYQAENITEYPLISKTKKFRSFQSVVTEFFDSLIKTLHSSSVLYSDAALIENIQVWVSSMSSAPIRPFRHTATIVSLAIVTTLCNVAREVTSTLSNTRKQLEAEKKKRSANKGRIGAMQDKVQEAEKKLGIIDDIVKDSFDTVFVHRYRDVDPKIRAECMGSLGNWIHTYRESFFEGQYLRYLGWVLSDTAAQTRAVVINQLHRLFKNKDNIAGLRGFTERFRPRIVEMATRDAEPSVRAAAVELLDLVRDAGLLEPDDIDSIGRLVFDTEARVRKAAGKFFVANIQDVYDTLTESLDEEMNEYFVDDEDDDNFETPKRTWIKFKCLADILQVYDGQEAEIQAEAEEGPSSRSSLVGCRVDSRFVLATEAIYPHLEDLQQWENLAGYLLYDHSQIQAPSSEDDAANTMKNMFRLEEGQEGILLEVLGCSVKLHIVDVSKSDADKRGRKTKLLVERMEARQESTAHNLSQLIPRLLNKFGAVPEAASAILRLEHLVDLDLIQDLQKDAAAYSDIISNVNKQFLTHSHQGVLAEATVAFLHARTSDELKEAMENKVQELWDDTLDALRTLSSTKGKDTSNLSVNTLKGLTNTVMRVSNLASVSDCTALLESIPRTTSKKQKSSPEPIIDILLELAKRGLRDADADEEVEDLERELLTHTFKTLLVYFMWKVQATTAALSSGTTSLDDEYFESLSGRRDSFVAVLTAIMQGRTGVDPVRLAGTTTLLDLQTVFGTLRNAGMSGKNMAPIPDDDIAFQVHGLVQETAPETQTLISHIHDAAEKAFAKKSRRKLEPLEDDAPMDSQSDIESILSDDEDEDADNDDSLAAHRARTVLLAERRLCELTGKIVLAIIGGVVDASGSQRGKLRKKILRNKTRLGQNYKEVLAYLDNAKQPANKRRIPRPNGVAAPATASGAVNGNKANSKAKSAERIEDSDEDEGPSHIEEDEVEDLQARELMDEDEGEEAERAGSGDESDLSPPPDDIEDDIMGD
ncbi:hypothetical protein AJ80_06379 [Polytolypa hystricis UAMH7299]|uniref:SCD domain-containing protein n=1 Tax=Polytolypa hystricis (strain UAMH7299) TaxID=1447883 RepID=A0A2B7XWE9_POLH7|nr:hypothetical protein AJ80_06379 [Polytolypa hystricis UAMH7299]